MLSPHIQDEIQCVQTIAWSLLRLALSASDLTPGLLCLAGSPLWPC